jgi:DNA-binding NtrC family response regulator
MSGSAFRLLLVEDDALEARLLKANLEPRGRGQVDLAASGEEALEKLERRPYDAVVTDLVMPGMDGIELVRRIRAFDGALPVVLITAHGSVERAVEGIRAGATDFLPKPVNVDALLALTERAIAERPLREAHSARRGRREPRPSDYLVGDHPRLEEVRAFAEQLARTPNARVLITGESGTGKRELARAIHDLSGARGRFVEVNCAALPPTLLESELFGHEKGAFTDAREAKRGLIELAHNGTLLLDEIGSLSTGLQGKLLLFLESQEIRRVGGTRPIEISTRVIAATNEDLHERLRDRSFRMDLFYRLDVVSVEMPPLREIPAVIPELAGHLLRRLSDQLGRPAPELARESFDELARYEWPGNARELRNAIERALIFHRGGPLAVRPPTQTRGAAPVAQTAGDLVLEPGLRLDEVERRYIAAALERHGGQDLERVAEELGIARKTLWEKRRRYGL